ncbi:MAG: isochorismate synthase [Chlamydiota bacterium]
MSYLSLRYPITLQDPLSYLETKNLYPKIFWQSSSQIRIGLGKLLSSDTPPIFNKNKDDCWFGSIPFMENSSEKEDPWKDFIFPDFFLPSIYLELNPHDYTGTISFHYLESERPPKDLIDSYMQDRGSYQPKWDPCFLERKDNPSFDKWSCLINKALETFEKTPLKKVVLARATSLLFKESINPLSIVNHLKSHTLNSTLFAYIPSKNSAFIGSSPETFYTRTDLNLKTAAVAGTRKRGLNKEEDKSLCLELLQGAKEKEEFQHVVDFFEKVLSNLCKHYEKTLDITLRQTTTVQHLYHQFQGYLYPFVTDSTLIENLHPTPAVGGLPRNLALTFLKDNEPFHRGLYAAPLGWISQSQTDLIVAIRSSLVNHNQLVLFAGVGVVKGSDPVKEWEELEDKISQFIKGPSYAR